MDMKLITYERQVEEWVHAALHEGATSLNEVVKALPGVYPSVVRSALLRIAPLLKETQSVSYLPSLEPQQHKNCLPAPHPLDYDWRFHDHAIALLLTEVNMRALPGERIVLLGTPTILHTALASSQPYQFTLLEANPVMVNWFKQTAPGAHVEHCVIGQDQLPVLSGSVVIADPPWYEEHARAFLWAATQFCTLGGTVLLSVPPLGTRPGISEEWKRLLGWAEQLGLELIRMEREALAYTTPPFEHNALKVDEISIMPTWRHGDLAIFSLRHRHVADYPLLPTLEEKWNEICLDGVRVRLRSQHGERLIDPTLLPLIDGDILPSVSRRDARRQLADVWTSGNRIFACRNTNVMATILGAYINKKSPLNAVSTHLGRLLTASERIKIKNAFHQLDLILAHERQEVAGFWQGSIGNGYT